MNLIKLEDVSKSFNQKQLFTNFNLKVDKGEFLGIKGESGSGKSTLLNIIGLLEKCDGKVIIEGAEISSEDTREVRRMLKNKFGYLFQNFALIDDLTVYENLKIVMDGYPKEERVKMILKALGEVGLENVLDKKIFQLSGGEQQRIAIVRLMLKKCEIILADEPTGSLDKKNAKIIIDLLKAFHTQGKTIIMVSHDENAFLECSRVINL